LWSFKKYLFSEKRKLNNEYPILFQGSLIYFLKVKKPTFLLKLIYEYYAQAVSFSLRVRIKPDQQIEAAGLTGSN